MGKYDDRPYEVGKGKPPAAHRWRKGTSGNPLGPRKRANRDDATFKELLADIINEKVKVTINGREGWLTKKEMILIGLVHDAVNGTPAARLRAYRELKEAGALDLLPSGKQSTPEQQKEAIAKLVEELAEFAAEHDPKYAAELAASRMPAIPPPTITGDM